MLDGDVLASKKAQFMEGMGREGQQLLREPLGIVGTSCMKYSAKICERT